MNKKINLLLVGLLVFCTSFVNISAKATYPSTNPTVGKDLYATLDEEFDFSKVKFGEAVGSSSLKKIFLGDYDSTNAFTLKNSFSAYCLDASKTYPDRGYVSIETLSKYKDYKDTPKVMTVLIASLFNSQYNFMSNELSGYKQIPNLTYQFDGITDTEFLSALKACKTNSSCNLSNKVSITGMMKVDSSEVTSTSTLDKTITATLENSLYEKYKVEEANTANVKGYEKAMWIISNTYPMVTLDTMLSKIDGVTLASVKSDIAAIEGTDATDDLVDSYIYSIVQYAIWYVTGSKDADNNTIGATLSAVDSDQKITNLSKIYSYLITEGSKHDTYTPSDIKINVNKPNKLTEKETDTAITTGVFSFSTDSSLVNTLSVTIADNEKGNIKLLDSNLKEMTPVNGVYELKSGEEFTISVPRKANITKVTINATAKGEVYDVKSSRKYSPYLVLNQSFITGRMTTEIDASATLTVDIGPATGVQNVAILLIVTLVSFSIGYLVLGYKNKPMEI